MIPAQNSDQNEEIAAALLSSHVPDKIIVFIPSYVNYPIPPLLPSTDNI
jgi:hypothetical protein